jgi:hypothetical protein
MGDEWGVARGLEVTAAAEIKRLKLQKQEIEEAFRRTVKIRVSTGVCVSFSPFMPHIDIFSGRV